MKNRIKELRKKRITQAKLVENMDISRQYISLLEKNEIEPSMKVANEIRHLHKYNVVLFFYACML